VFVAEKQQHAITKPLSIVTTNINVLFSKTIPIFHIRPALCDTTLDGLIEYCMVFQQLVFNCLS